MRNKDRIPDVLFEIERIWKKTPDLRFYQLVDNLTDLYKKEKGLNYDSFYVEDDGLLEWLKEFEFNRNGAKRND